MRVAVTGGNGFVGSALSLRLRALGHDVHALVRPGVQHDALVQAGAVLHSADLADPNSLATALAGSELVFHCATENAWHTPREVLAWINVAGTENVVRAARHVGARRLVQLSCADVALIDRDRVHWKENAVLGQQPLGALARSKLLAEELALQASDARMAVVAVRPAWLWGPGERSNLPALAAEARRGGVKLFGSGEVLFSTAHIDNVIAALIAAGNSERGAGLALHVADNDYLTSGEFFGRLSQALRWPAPRRGIYALEYAAAWLRRARGAEGAWPEQVARRGRACLLDCLQAVNVLDFTAEKTVDAGLAELATWAESLAGPSAIERLARPAADRAEIARHAHIADQLDR